MLPILLIFTIAEGDVAKDSGLKLGNLLLEDSKVFIGNLKDLSCILVKLDGFSIGSLLEFELSFLFGSIDLGLNLVELWLQLIFLF